MAINPLGTECPSITYQYFLQILKQTYQKYQQELSLLKEIVFTLRAGKPFKPFVDAIKEELKVIPEVYT